MSKKEIPIDGVSDENPNNKQSMDENEGIWDNVEDNIELDEILNDAQKEQTTSDTSTKSAGSSKDQLEKELSEMKDKYLRLFAEFDNFRKRTIKERQDLIKLASKDSLEALLPAVGDFERAIKAAHESENAEKIPEGIILIYNKLFKALEQQGIKEMESTGQSFDPDLHEAIVKIPAPTQDLKGKVIDTIERGYYLNDKIIRYAKVVVGE